MIADDIAAKIADGTYQAGRRLPNERELAEEYGAARETVRKAIVLLREQGKLITVRGKGHFVSEPENGEDPASR
jgi:GntR family transcriptional regulator